MDDEQILTRQLRDPSLQGIITESKQWWTGIKNGEIKFIPALPLIAEYIPAYIPGHMIVVSGYTSAGKSQLISQIATWAAGIHEAETIIFSLEDSRMEKMFSLVSCVSETIHRRQLITGEIDSIQHKIDETFSAIEHWPLEIYDDVYFLDKMEDIIKTKKPKLAILDYVQKVRCIGKIYDRMAHAAHEIFRIGQDEKCTMIVASQIAVGAAQNDNPDIIPLKGAGDLAEAAHAVVQLRKGRREENKQKVLIDIKKNKAFGNIGTIKGQFNRHWTLIQKEDEEVHVG